MQRRRRRGCRISGDCFGGSGRGGRGLAGTYRRRRYNRGAAHDLVDRCRRGGCITSAWVAAMFRVGVGIVVAFAVNLPDDSNGLVAVGVIPDGFVGVSATTSFSAFRLAEADWDGSSDVHANNDNGMMSASTNSGNEPRQWRILISTPRKCSSVCCSGAHGPPLRLAICANLAQDAWTCSPGERAATL